METWARAWDGIPAVQAKVITKAVKATEARPKPDITLLKVQGGTDWVPSSVRGRDDPLRPQRRATKNLTEADRITAKPLWYEGFFGTGMAFSGKSLLMGGGPFLGTGVAKV